MPNFPSPFGWDERGLFTAYDEFVPDDLPEPGPFLEAHDVLAGAEHVAFHRLTRALFEERKVYDMTFNYNLARLNLDTRHPEAGYRYAVERPDADDAVDLGAAGGDRVGDEDVGVDESDGHRVLRAAFTPTTPFCPQTHTLTIGSFRAWNGLSDRHEYDLVRVRAAPMHHRSEAIDEQLADLERPYLEEGDPEAEPEGAPDVGSNPMERAMQESGTSRGPQAPF